MNNKIKQYYIDFNSIQQTIHHISNDMENHTKEALIIFKKILKTNSYKSLEVANSQDIELRIILEKIKALGDPNTNCSAIEYKYSIKESDILEETLEILDNVLKSNEVFFNFFKKLDKLQRLGKIYINKRNRLNLNPLELSNSSKNLKNSFNIDDFKMLKTPINSNGDVRVELISDTFDSINKQDLLYIRALDNRYLSYRKKRLKLCESFSELMNKSSHNYNVFEDIIELYK
ncbi:MAG TPA: hypothetical protein EYH09_02310 [Candidatus Nanopusillus sp.]|nr:hypothetical protein [Candidatus Nanopusillus sp.]